MIKNRYLTFCLDYLPLTYNQRQKCCWILDGKPQYFVEYNYYSKRRKVKNGHN